LADKRITLITGANQGVGFQLAKELVAAGNTVLLGSRNLERGEEAAKQITGAIPIQIDVTDRASIAAAAERVRTEFGRLDLLVQNAGISTTRPRQPGEFLQDYAKNNAASTVSIDEVRAIWDTNVFGVLAVHQAMLPLLRLSSDPRIVIVSSGVGSLATNADPAYPYHKIYGPGYAASKTALNGMALAMMVELEDTNVKINVVSPAFTATALNNFAGTESVEDGSREVVRVALLGPDGPTGTFTRWENTTIPW
jgi:NAD(P)-dependent dehydrogenase (short-subunit alcohol dehydrogenase family)